MEEAARPSARITPTRRAAGKVYAPVRKIIHATAKEATIFEKNVRSILRVSSLLVGCLRETLCFLSSLSHRAPNSPENQKEPSIKKATADTKMAR